MRHGTTSTTNIGSSSSSVKVAVAHVWLAYGRQLRHLVLDVPSWGEPTKGQVADGGCTALLIGIRSLYFN